MKKERDDIIAADEDYGGMNWETISVDNLHEVCRNAIFNNIIQHKALTARFDNLRSHTALEKREEKKWLVTLLDSWFTKKWNNKRGANAKKAENPRKRKAACCSACNEVLHCLACEGISTEV